MSRNVLLADGDVTTLELMSAVLIRNGFDVQSTNDGGDALARAMELEPELVICDEDIPGGISISQLCQQLRYYSLNARLVVLCSSDVLDDDPEELCAEYHCDAVLARPFRFGPLRELLRGWELGDEKAEEGALAGGLSFSVAAPAIPELVGPAELAVAAPEPIAATPPAAATDVGAMPMPIPIPIPVPEPPPHHDAHLEEQELDIDMVVTDTVVTPRDEAVAEAPAEPTAAEPEAAPSVEAVAGHAASLDLEIDLEDAIVATEPVAMEAEPAAPAPGAAPGPEPAPLISATPEPVVVAAERAATPSRPPEPVPLPDGVSRSGDLSVTPLPRLVFELYIGTYTGVLRMLRAGVRRAIIFRAGLPVRVDSEKMDETLGFMLRDDGRITDEQLDAAQNEVEAKGGFFGEALVSMGALRESELLDALREQTERKLANSFAWRDGIYELEDDSMSSSASIVSEVNPLAAIFRGIREHYELTALLDYFGQLRTRYVVASPQFAVHAKTIVPHLEYFDIEEILDGKQTFEQALMLDAAHSLEISQALYFLLVTEMVTPEEEPGEPAPKVDLPAQARGQVLVDYAALMDASDRIAREYLGIMQKDYFTALALAHDATPDQVKAACDDATQRIRKDADLPGLPHDAARRAREVLETVARARKLLLHSRRRDRYLKKLERKGATDKKPVDQRRERLIGAERLYKDGVRLLKEEDGNAAYLKLDEAVRTNASEPTYRVALAQAILLKYADRGAKARSLAYTHIEEALRLDPSNMVANLEAARILHGEGQTDMARGHVERVLQRAPHHQAARRMLLEFDAS